MTEEKTNLLKRSSTSEPKNTFKRENIFSVASEVTPKKEVPPVSRGKRTSVSCFQETKNKVHALMTVTGTKNADEMLEKLLDSYTDILTDHESTEFKMIKKTLDRQTIRK